MSIILNQLTPEYIDDVLVRLAHHSSAIEGNTISLPETATIILDQTLPNNSKITKREYFEVLNHQDAFDYIFHNLENDMPLSVDIIQGIHQRLTDRLQHDSGKFKTSENYIKGVDFETASPAQTPELIKQLIENLQFQISHAESDEGKIKAILEGHIAFEKIHPFSDGNGRTGRMIMAYSLLSSNLPPLIIKKEDRDKYGSILHSAQVKTFPDKEDINSFYHFALPLLENEQARIQSFHRKKENMIDIENDDGPGIRRVNTKLDKLLFNQNNQNCSKERSAGNAPNKSSKLEKFGEDKEER